MHSAVITTELRYPAMPLARQLEHKRFVHPGPLVLRTGPLKSPAPTTDRDRTVSRRSEPSSRTALIGEQPNPWNLLQLQDAMSRHRGAKPERRYELLAPISLLSPAYLLSVERWPFHAEPPDQRYAGDNRLIGAKSSYRRSGLAPRCRLIASWSCRGFQGLGCSPIKAVRELGSERRETVRSLSDVGVGDLRGPVLSTRGPGWTNLLCSSCHASGTAG